MGVVSDTGRGLFRGCFSSHRTKFAVLDIDIDSRYQNAAELQKLQALLAAVGLYVIPYRSSDSGGWHLYLPFEEWAETDEVEQTLKTWLKCLGYKIVGGQLEIFPSGNALRLPLQKGFAWLNPDGSIKVRREEIREDEALASFLQDFEVNARNWQEAKRLIGSQIDSAGSLAGAGVQEHEKVISLEGLEELFKRGKIEEVWKNGRDYWLLGLTGKNQRHDAVMAVGHYLWYGDVSENVPAYPGRRNDETRARLIEAWLKKKHNGFCNHINRGHWGEIEAHIWRTVFWRRGKNYQARKPYPMTDRVIKRLIEVYNKTGQLFEIDRMAEANNARLEDARSRIKKAIQELVTEGVVLTKSEVARRAGCNRRTVVKHSDLLAFWPSVYNRGVWGVSSGSVVPEVGFEKKENSENLLCSNSDSGDLETTQLVFDLSSNGTETHSREIPVRVAPLQFCPANSQPESTQLQDQALRVAAQVLTPGPLLSGIPSEWQVCAGGISFISRTEDSAAPGACYTVATAGSIKEQAGAASGMGALVPFGAKIKNEKIIPDATNYRFLTTGKPGYSSGLADEFSLIQNITESGEQRKPGTRGILETTPPGRVYLSLSFVLNSSVTVSGYLAGSQKPNGSKDSQCVVHILSYSVRLSGKWSTHWLRGPPCILTS
jgi:predicted transcriptional regulator